MSSQTDSSSSSSRNSYKDQIHVKGQYGTGTFRRKDTPDIGAGDIEYVADFDGVVNYRGDSYVGPVSVGETLADDFEDDVDGRVHDLTLHDFIDNE